MYRTGENHSKHNCSSSSSSSLATTNEKLKQKKRLSFREPEVEIPHNSNWSNTNRIQSKPSALLATNVDVSKHSASLEDLTLEDQTFIIAKHVGQAFDKRPCERRQLSTTTSTSKTSCSADYRSVRRNSDFLIETLQNDCSHARNAPKKNGSNSRSTVDSEDAQYFEALSPPILNMSTMKFPAIEVSESKVAKPNQALVASTDVVSTSIQHQMQFLKYQLEQQRQQTQAALAHIQLLKDQLQAETSARYKAQSQNHQLIIQNKELLDHIQNLFRQIQDLEKLLEKQEQKPTFPSSSTNSSQESQKTQVKEVTVANVVTTQKNNNNECQSTKISAFAPNPIMANRRSSLTGLKPFQSKTTYLEPNVKRGDEVRLSSRSSSPAPPPTNQIRNLASGAEANKTNNPHGERSFLFNSTRRYDGNGDDRSTRHDGIKDRSTKEWQSATKTSENLPVSSISIPNLTSKNTMKGNTKPLMHSELNSHGEHLLLNDNPFLIEEKPPGKLEDYASRKGLSSGLLSSDRTTDKISSVALSPKSNTSWSKFPKFQNNDSVLPLAFDDTANLCIKENKRFSSETSSRLFNS